MKANEISMEAAVVSANVFTFKRSKNCNFLFLCQAGSRAARFGGSLDPVTHDIIYDHASSFQDMISLLRSLPDIHVK